LVNLFFYK